VVQATACGRWVVSEGVELSRERGRRRISVEEGAGVGKRRRRSYTAEEGNHA
jgi:hypothetical protein